MKERLKSSNKRWGQATGWPRFLTFISISSSSLPFKITWQRVPNATTKSPFEEVVDKGLWCMGHDIGGSYPYLTHWIILSKMFFRTSQISNGESFNLQSVIFFFMFSRFYHSSASIVCQNISEIIKTFFAFSFLC